MSAALMALLTEQRYQEFTVWHAVQLCGEVPLKDLPGLLPGFDKPSLSRAVKVLRTRHLLSDGDVLRTRTPEGLEAGPQLTLLPEPTSVKRSKGRAYRYGPGDPEFAAVNRVFDACRTAGLVPKEARLLNRDGTDVAVKDWAGTGRVFGRYHAIKTALERYQVEDLIVALQWAAQDRWWAQNFEPARFFMEANIDQAMQSARSGVHRKGTGHDTATTLRTTSPTSVAVRQ